MANIGTFTKAEDGTLNGTIKTLQLNTKAKFSPLDATSNGGPDFRIFAGNVEIGAAWKRVSQQDAATSRSSWTIRAFRLRSSPPSTRTTRPAS